LGVLTFVAIAGTLTLLIGPLIIAYYLKETYQMPNQVIALVSTSVGIFGGVLTLNYKKETTEKEIITK